MENDLTTFTEQTLAPQEAETEKQDTLDSASKLLMPTFASLDATQKNALGISSLVDHVEELSGREQYVQANDAIMQDPTLSIQEKLRLKRENDEWQDQRTSKSAGVVVGLQNANARNNSNATNSWVGPLLICCGIGAGVFFGFTKQGKQLAIAAFKAARQLAA